MAFRYLILFLITLPLAGCPSYDPQGGTLTIFNNSDSAIYVYSTCGDSIEASPKLKLFEKWPGKALDKNGNRKDSVFSPNYRINAYSYGELSGFGSISHKRLPCQKGGKVTFFFITESTMKSHPWEEISKNQLFKMKREITKEGLDSIDWYIRYNPNQ